MKTKFVKLKASDVISMETSPAKWSCLRRGFNTFSPNEESNACTFIHFERDVAQCGFKIFLANN